jgi:hypothetical protein
MIDRVILVLPDSGGISPITATANEGAMIVRAIRPVGRFDQGRIHPVNAPTIEHQIVMQGLLVVKFQHLSIGYHGVASSLTVRFGRVMSANPFRRAVLAICNEFELGFTLR